jgi:hypothetical protein
MPTRRRPEGRLRVGFFVARRSSSSWALRFQGERGASAPLSSGPHTHEETKWCTSGWFVDNGQPPQGNDSRAGRAAGFGRVVSPKSGPAARPRFGMAGGTTRVVCSWLAHGKRGKAHGHPRLIRKSTGPCRPGASPLFPSLDATPRKTAVRQGAEAARSPGLWLWWPGTISKGLGGGYAAKSEIISVGAGKFRGCEFPLTRVQGPHLSPTNSSRPHGRGRLVPGIYANARRNGAGIG